jgi:uncharacterized membrane protein YdfJ with MMPL/SSD domain
MRGLTFAVTLGQHRFPKLVFPWLDLRYFKPYEVRRTKHEHLADETHGFWKRVGDRVAQGPRRVLIGSTAVLLVLCAGLAFFSTDLTTNDSYRTEVESVEGQELLSQSFPSGATAPTDVIVADPTDVPAVTRAVEGAPGVESVSGPVAEGDRGVLVQATLEPPPYSTEAFDLVEPIREAAQAAAPETLVGGATAVEFDVREAAAWDSAVIPPIVLVVVFAILAINFPDEQGYTPASTALSFLRDTSWELPAAVFVLWALVMISGASNAAASPSQKRGRERRTYQFDSSSTNSAIARPANVVS